MDFASNLRSCETSNLCFFHINLIFYWRKGVRNRADSAANEIQQSWQAFPIVCDRFECKQTIFTCVFAFTIPLCEIHEIHVFGTFLC